MKVERWEEESDEDWAERLAEEIALANNTETTKYFVERDPYDEEGVIINYIGETGWTWKEHPEGPFKASEIIDWKNKAEKWDELQKTMPSEELLKKMEECRVVEQKLEVIKSLLIDEKILYYTPDERFYHITPVVGGARGQRVVEEIVKILDSSEFTTKGDKEGE